MAPPKKKPVPKKRTKSWESQELGDINRYWDRSQDRGGRPRWGTREHTRAMLNKKT